MKKLLSVILVIAMLFAFSATAFAYESAGGTKYSQVVVNDTSDGKNESTTVKVTEGGTVEVTAEESTRKFNGFEVYKKGTATGTVVSAKLGVDYELVSVKKANGNSAVKGTDYSVNDGSIKSLKNEYLTVEIKPLNADLFVSTNYQGVNIKFDTESGVVLSPATGDNSVNVLAVLAVIVLLSGAAVVFTAKRAYNR